MRPADAAAFGEIALVANPLGRYREIPAEPLDGIVLIDANNHFERRDGRIEEIASGRVTSSELLQAHVSGARMVEAVSAIRWARLLNDGRPAGAADRIAIPIAGDDQAATSTLASLIDQIGFDWMDAGTLAKRDRRFAPGSPLFTADLTRSEVAERLSG